MWTAAGKKRLAFFVQSVLQLGQAGVGDLAQPKEVLEKAETCTDPKDSTQELGQSQIVPG